MTSDQKHRNAYKREWRNRRNYLQLTEEIMKLEEARRRSWMHWNVAVSERWVDR